MTPGLVNCHHHLYQAATKGLAQQATLFGDSNLDAQVDGTNDTIPGCMSSEGDPECPPLFAKVGLSFESASPGPAQTFFGVTQ